MSHSTTRLVVTPASAGLRRSLRPIEWVVLEDLALDARADDAGALVAATSARRVAERLGLTLGAAAKALSGLRVAGLVTHDRRVGPAGRFGLSMYTLTLPPGLEVIAADEIVSVAAGQPVGGSPRPVPPHVESPRAVDRHMAVGPARATATAIPPAMSSAGGAEIVVPRRSARRRVAGGGNDLAKGAAGGRVTQPGEGRSAVRSSRSTRRPLGDRPPAQLSILDLTDDASDAIGREPTPASTRVTTTETTTAQRPSARPTNAIPRPLNPSA